MRRYLLAFVAAVATVLSVALPASAATVAITAATSVSAHPDTTNASGPACTTSANGPVWADDTYTSTMTALQTGTGTWRVTLQDSGSFLGFADPTTCKASLSTGNFNGDYTVTVNSPVAPSAAFLHKSYSGAVSTTQMITDFFDDAIGVKVTGGDYFFIYQSGNYVQTTTSIYGDVVPAPAPVLSLAYCGTHVWRVTQNASLIATKFHYFSKVGTTYLLDGSATVPSAGSVKVTERPRAVGGLEVRYLSNGKMVTVIGSRTTSCGSVAVIHTVALILATPVTKVYNFPPCYNSARSWCDPQVRPHGLMHFGSTITAGRFVWHTWTHTSATASIQLRIDNCLPNCAKGHWDSFAATMALNHVLIHRGTYYFQRMVVRWREGGFPQTQVVLYERHGGTIVFWG